MEENDGEALVRAGAFPEHQGPGPLSIGWWLPEAGQACFTWNTSRMKGEQCLPGLTPGVSRFVGSLPTPSPADVPMGRKRTGRRARSGGAGHAPAWGRTEGRQGAARRGEAGHLSRGMEKSRKAAASWGAWSRASRVMARRACSFALGMDTEQSCRWMARPRLPTCAGRKSGVDRASLGGARPCPGDPEVGVLPWCAWRPFRYGPLLSKEARPCSGGIWKGRHRPAGVGAPPCPAHRSEGASQSGREAARPLGMASEVFRLCVNVARSLGGSGAPTSSSPEHTSWHGLFPVPGLPLPLPRLGLSHLCIHAQTPRGFCPRGTWR